ncbi:MAG: hypothetical protein IPP66_08420 [Anaerolineales bacterium]|nr:hypothetical protein [Anaerolineales bacterium]
MPVNWIEHKEKRIIFINAANLMDDHVSLIAKLETLVSLLQPEPKKSILAMADLRNTHLTNTALIGLMRNAIRAAPYFRKSALIIEANPAQKILLDSFSYVIPHPPKRFSDIDEAKEWLVSE